MGIIGILLITVGPMLIVITINDSLLIKNILLIVLETFCIFIGAVTILMESSVELYRKIKLNV